MSCIFQTFSIEDFEKYLFEFVVWDSEFGDDQTGGGIRQHVKETRQQEDLGHSLLRDANPEVGSVALCDSMEED